MIRLTHSKEENPQTRLKTEAVASSETEQILHLKRLLVTLKQNDEKSLQQIQIQLQVEQNQRIAIQKELEKTQVELSENQKLHEEELQALREQQVTLKDLFKKGQEELCRLRTSSNENLSKEEMNCQSLVPDLRAQLEETHLEIDLLQQELSEAQKKVKSLEQELKENQQNARKEIEQLEKLVEEQKLQGSELETVVSTTSSHYLRRELENIKRTIAQESQETTVLETRYVEILNEKIRLENQCKQLQVQLENQSSNLTAFQKQMHELEDRNLLTESALQSKEAEWIESCQQRQELQAQIVHLNALVKEREFIQDKYEQLKEEWKQMNERLEEAIGMRVQADQHVHQLEDIATSQESQLQEFVQQLQFVQQEKGNFESERDQLRTLLEESETRLKVAQQHLAKKVKEAALLGEKSEDQQIKLSDFAQTIESQKTQLAQLQASVDLYQRQEQRLQEQLHDALKGTESQIVKWEEKYFRMYEKWQESENRNRELKKFEEKHFQMQNLLTNLGSFMGGNLGSAHAIPHVGAEFSERPVMPSFSMETPLTEEIADTSKIEPHEEKYNLFGMRQPPDKNNTSFS